MTGRARRAAWVALAAVLVVPAWLAVGTPAASDVTITEVGWWSARPGASARPKGGFEVATVLGEEQSVAALRVKRVDGILVTAKITLVESAGVGQQVGALRVCPTIGFWKAANPGALADAPEPDCRTYADLTHDAEAGTWSGEIGSVLPFDGGVSSVMVVPAPPPPDGPPVTPALQVTIERASVEAVVTSGEPIPVPADTATTPTFDDATETGADDPVADDPVVDDVAPVDDGAPAADDPPAATPDTTAPAVPTPADDETAEDTEDEFVAGPISDDDSGRPWGRLLILVPLSVLAGGGAVAGKRLSEGRPVLTAARES